MPPAPISLPRSEVADVLRSYNQGKLQFIRPAAGTANPAVIAVTSTGQFFIKRRNPRYCSSEQLSYDHDVIRKLAQAGLPVTPPRHTVQGSRWLALEGQIYEVYELIVGTAHEYGNPAQVSSAGSVLGAFHTATADLEPKARKLVSRLHDPKASLRGLAWARTQLADHDPLRPEDLGRVQRLIAVAEGVSRALPDETYWRLPQCVIHGDYHPANLKFDGDEVAGIFDFDWVARQPRMVDVADGLAFFCGRRKRPTEPGDIVSLTQAYEIDRELACAFGRGYVTGIEPTRDELEALPHLMRARWLFCRVDAMERKIPAEQKLDYLLNEIETPLAQIDAASEWLVSGEWLRV